MRAAAGPLLVRRSVHVGRGQSVGEGNPVYHRAGVQRGVDAAHQLLLAEGGGGYTKTDKHHFPLPIGTIDEEEEEAAACGSSYAEGTKKKGIRRCWPQGE